MVRVVVSRERCVGGGLCVLVAPQVFDQSPDGRVVLRDGSPPPDLDDALEEAQRVCPGQALEVSPG